LRDHRHRSGRKTLVQRAKSGDPDVRLQATWGISGKAGQETGTMVAHQTQINLWQKSAVHDINTVNSL